MEIKVIVNFLINKFFITIGNVEVQQIKNSNELQSYCKDLINQEWLAIDTEFIRENTYYPKLCLIQIATMDHITCIDTLSIKDLSDLHEPLYKNEITKVFHAASQDLEIFFHLFNNIPTPVFDTQIAASALGYGDQISYAELVKSICNVNLDKSLSRTAWDKRPLSERELQYAIDDVKYLADIFIRLKQELLSKNRTHWVEEECKYIYVDEKYSLNFDSFWKQVKGSGKLLPSQLMVLKLLAEWREKQAIKENIPRKWVLNDKTLLTLAIEKPTTENQILQHETLNSSQCKKYIQPLLGCIHKAENLPESEWPSSYKSSPLNREQRKLLKSALQFTYNRAEELNIAPSLLATRNIIEKLIRGKRELNILQSWRYELIGKDLINLLEQGEIT